MKRTLLLSAFAALAFASCKKNDSYTATTNTGGGNNGTQAQMSYQLTATNTTSGVGNKTTAGSITWTSGFANPHLVKFEARQGTTQIEYKSTNDAQIDLMAPSPITFGGFTIPDGTYDEIELQIFLDKHGPSPALQLQGTYNNGALSLPVRIEVNEEIELKTEQENVTVTNGDNIIALTTMDLADATIDVRESMLLSATLTNGVVVISATSNRTLYNMIVDKLRNKKHHCNYKHHHK